jgi:hypothetical protein
MMQRAREIEREKSQKTTTTCQTFFALAAIAKHETKDVVLCAAADYQFHFNDCCCKIWTRFASSYFQFGLAKLSAL